MKKKNNKLIVVLGMHRSGTIAISKSLEVFGVGLGSKLHPEGLDNPKGFLEDIDCININESLLTYCNSDYDRLNLAWEDLRKDARVCELRLIATQHINRKLKDNNGLWGFKDSRTCQLLGFWNDVFAALTCEINFLVVVRNPASVVSSLIVRNKIPAEKAYFLWLQHVLPSLSFMKDKPRLVVDYDELLENPYAQLLRISSKFGLTIPDEKSALVANFKTNFLDINLRHTLFTESELALDNRAPEIVVPTYNLLHRLAKDQASLESPEIQNELSILNTSLKNLAPAFDYINAIEDERANLWVAVGTRDAQLVELNEVLGARDEQLVSISQSLQDLRLEQVRKNVSTNHTLRELRRIQEQQIAKFKADRDNQIDILNNSIYELQHANKEILASMSWWVTKPLRAVPKIGRYLWHALPIYSNAKRKLKGFVFIYFSWLFSWSSAYRAWENFNTQTSKVAEDVFIDDKRDFEGASQLINQAISDHLDQISHHLPLFDEKTDSEYVPLLISKPLENKPVKLICFYLPQFHSIRENNEWWGNGFTEWANVEPARAQFEGHYQPHVPGELGYYNLLDTEVQRRQVELAKLYGIEGFCFYFYWFAGKRLLEAPIQNYLNDSSLDLPFCLCWANENWTRRWDGCDNEILIAQDYSAQDDLAFITYIAQYMRDPRYIRIDGKPLLIVYRPGMLPSVKESVNCWRQWCKNNGIGEIYIAYSQSFEAVDPREYGFDAAIEFPPNHSTLPNITDTVIQYGEEFNCTVYDWQVFVDKSNNYHHPDYKLFRGVCPSWDNTARRKNRGTAFLNSTPALYQKWLENAVQDTIEHQTNPDERLVFINAWNEWAEGAHLEPDTRYGYAWLQATRDALVNVVANDKRQKIIVVSHDAHPHGAQFLALGMVRSLKQDLHLDIEVVLLGKGRLTRNFAALAPVHDLSDRIAGDEKITHLANLLVQRGFTRAIVNTTVSGVVIPAFHKAGIESICLVHELPGVIQDNKLENQAKQIANYAKTVVFPAQMVADGFVQFAQIDQDKQIIRPQGLYRRNKWRLEKQAAKVKLRADLGLNPDTKIVLTVGYVDHRKGADLFVECALTLLAKRTDVDFVWVGHWEQTMQKEIEAKLSNNPYKHRIHFVGYNSETALFHAASDVYALTSREDPFPNVVLESFDAGVPVVAFAGTGGAAHLVENLGGRVVPLENVDKFSDAVCELLDNVEICSSLGVAGQNYVDKHFAFRPYMFELCSMLGIELPKISVVVPNYNYARYIEERLASIRNQSIPIYELIILDDASTDTSIHKISDWLAVTQTEAKVVINQNNSGSVFAQWQKGIEIATGDFLWIAEADDLSDPDFLETVMPPLVSGEVVLSYCESQQMNSHGTTQVKNYHNYLAAVCQNKWKSAYVTTGDEEIKSSLAILNTIPNVSAVVFKRDTINTVFKQHFDEITQFKKAGDWVVYIYTLAHGDIAFSPRTANRHRRHDQSVVGESCQESLLKEIITVQEIAGKMHQISDGVRQKVEAYRSVLTK